MKFFCVLGSGSRGNATYVEEGETRILIDAGFSGRELARRLALIGRSPEQLTALLITHEHNDHITGAGVLSRRFSLPVYINHATYQAAAQRLGRLYDQSPPVCHRHPFCRWLPVRASLFHFP